MKHIFTRLIFSLFALVTLFATSNVASAQVIDVEFDPDPLFTGAELLPGDTMSGEFSVTNTSGVEQAVRMRAVETALGGLEDALTITVTGNGINYSDTLSSLYAHNFVPLSNIAGGATHTYDATVHFPKEKGNEYMNTTTAFKLCVGFAGNNENCVTTSTDPDPDTPTDPGGGGNGQCAPGVDCTDDGDPDDDGDPNLTDPDDDNDGTPDDDDPAPFDPGTPGVGGGPGITTLGITSPVGGTVATNQTVAEPEEETLLNEQSQLGAAAFLGLPETLGEAVECLSIFLLVLLAIYLLSLGFDALRDAPVLPDRERIQGRIAIITLLVLLAIAVALIIPIPCIVLPLILTGFGCVAAFIYVDLRLRRKERNYIR